MSNLVILTDPGVDVTLVRVHLFPFFAEFYSWRVRQRPVRQWFGCGQGFEGRGNIFMRL